MSDEQWFRRVKLLLPVENTLVAIILIAFFILHAFGESLFLPGQQKDVADVVISRTAD